MRPLDLLVVIGTPKRTGTAIRHSQSFHVYMCQNSECKMIDERLHVLCSGKQCLNFFLPTYRNGVTVGNICAWAHSVLQEKYLIQNGFVLGMRMYVCHINTCPYNMHDFEVHEVHEHSLCNTHQSLQHKSDLIGDRLLLCSTRLGVLREVTIPAFHEQTRTLHNLAV